MSSESTSSRKRRAESPPLTSCETGDCYMCVELCFHAMVGTCKHPVCRWCHTRWSVLSGERCAFCRSTTAWKTDSDTHRRAMQKARGLGWTREKIRQEIERRTRECAEWEAARAELSDTEGESTFAVFDVTSDPEDSDSTLRASEISSSVTGDSDGYPTSSSSE